VREQHVIGRVESISFKGAVVRFEGAVIDALRRNPDAVLALSGAIGGQVKIKVGRQWLLGNVGEIEADDGTQAGLRNTVRAQVDFLGEGDETPAGTLADFRRGVTRFPRTGDPVVAVNYTDLVELFGATQRPSIEIGAVYPTPDIRASLYIDPLLGKHFAILGSTGSGKSTATALILHRIIEKAPDAHVVVLDPHGEYGTAFKNQGVIYNVENLALPYWLMSFEEHCEVFIQSEGVERELDKAILADCLLAARGKNELARKFHDLTVNSPIPYLMFDLHAQLKAQMGKLDNNSAIARYMRLSNRIDEVLQDSRYSFMFNRALAADSMKDFLGRMLRLPGNGKPISIIDLSGVPSDLVSVVVALLARIVLDHAVWARNERPRPVLIVCEEAHRYLPAIAIQGSSAVRTSLERIAKEGRKYGVALGLVTQRPSDLAEGALSQCGTIIATSAASAMPCPKAAAASSIPFRRCAAASASSLAKVLPSRCASASTNWRPTSGHGPKIRCSANIGPPRAAKAKRWTVPFTAGAARPTHRKPRPRRSRCPCSCADQTTTFATSRKATLLGACALAA
jgi:hypothetical protein